MVKRLSTVLVTAFAFISIASAAGDPRRSTALAHGAFDPPFLKFDDLNRGDTISFSFEDTGVDHSVTESTFDDPCTPKPGGFDTEIRRGGGAILEIWILDESRWFYSKAASDCRKGMVFAILNSTDFDSNKFDAFREKATTSTGP